MKNQNDYWSEHNIGTRLTLVVFALSFFIIVVASLFGSIIPSVVVNMVLYANVLSFITVTLGINGLEILIQGIDIIKNGKRKNDEF